MTIKTNNDLLTACRHHEVTSLILALLLGWSGLSGAVSGRAAEASARDDKLTWWREARFGMFIHWGVYSIPAGVWAGAPVRGNAEHILMRARIPVAEYEHLASRFRPVDFDAAGWMQLAKEAGMRYVVFTAKHHDGFAMFDSRHSRFDIMDASPFKRDVVKELVEASRSAGLPFGLYYSHSRDWYHPGGAIEQGSWDPVRQSGNLDVYLRDVAVPQVRELLANYGPVAILWWDTPDQMTPERAKSFEAVLAGYPNLITNNRLWPGAKGDFRTPENVVPRRGLPGDWETCMTMNRSWGFSSVDRDWKSTNQLVQRLVDTVSKGGNFLLNVGPDSLGRLPEESVVRLRGMGAWLARNGEAIYGAERTPLGEMSWGRATRKGNRLFLHVFAWPVSGEIVVPIRNRPREIHLLTDRGVPARWTSGDDGLRVRLPAVAPDALSTTVVVELAGELDALPPPPIRQQGNEPLILSADTADVPGDHPRVEGSTRLGLGEWRGANAVATWDVDFTAAGSYEIFAVSEWPQAGGHMAMDLMLAGERVRLELGATSGAPVRRGVGRISVPHSGRLRVTLQSFTPNPPGHFRLLSLEFVRAR